MPLYEYECIKCTRKFVLLQKISAQIGETACPHCGTHDIQKLFSSFSSKTEASTETFGGNGGSHSCGSGGCGHA